MIKRILLLDDEVISTMFLSAFLSDDGFEVRASEHLHEALEVASTFKPDLLLADWILKDTSDGLTVAKKLMESLPDLKVIFITGLEREAVLERANEIPHIAILQKPIDLVKLSKVIQSLDETVAVSNWA